MNRFTEILPLVFTPLTPIHIGCGEDFEPTNYVIDNSILYQFEPSNLRLSESDRQLLIQSANRPGVNAILAVQRFFHDRRPECRRTSHREIPVATGVADWYEDRVGQVVQREGGGRSVANELGIERTAHHPYTGIPYLPGSSLKGSARTGWLNDLDNAPPRPRNRERSPAREESTQLENQILDGSFSSDPFRLVEFAELAGADLKSRVVFAVDRRKRPRADGKERDLAVRLEAIAGGQLRTAEGEIRVKSRHPKHTPRVDKCVGDFAALARACNRFYRGRLEADLRVLAGLGETRWARDFKSLMNALNPALDEGRAMLLRVGRHSGAESVTLERHRWIRIMEGPGSAHWARDATTIWLAADHEESAVGLRPFGWLLLEQADKLLEGQHLERWCDAELNATGSQSARRGAAVPTSASRGPREPARPSIRRGATVTYQGETAIIREIDGAEARIEFEGGDTEWVAVEKLSLS